MKNICLILAVFAGLSSCNPIPNISVFTTLDQNTIDKISQEDTTFVSYYATLQESKTLLNDVERLRFKDVTYRGLYKMYGFANDSLLSYVDYPRWEQEWEIKYGDVHEKADSIIAYWSDVLDELNLEKYVKVEFSHIQKDYYYYSDDVKDVKMAFKLTPLVSGIEQVRFVYGFAPKLGTISEFSSCIYTRPFNSVITRYWDVEYHQEKELKKLSTKDLKENFNFFILLTDVRKNGINYSALDPEMPKSVYALLVNNREEDADYVFLKEDLIKELIDKEYMSKYLYVSDKHDEYVKSIFPLEFEFSRLILRKRLRKMLNEAGF